MNKFSNYSLRLFTFTFPTSGVAHKIGSINSLQLDYSILSMEKISEAQETKTQKQLERKINPIKKSIISFTMG